eukprot:GFUD01008502.1.p1 GENE.GFUD01008502.1~~GFUD01008502.1.p1  ORF type:complete len:411 (-),score=89.31 GFUD01008502.1:138-1370(-)
MGQRILLLAILAGLFVNIWGDEKRLKVLSFGGNGNIGSAVLKRMIDSGSYDIVMSTRGSWHWDSEERIGPFVRFVKCNRDYQPACAADANATDCDINAIKQCKELFEIIQETDKFDIVLDFSGYEPKWIHDNCQVLKDKVGVYIYISTDSVYEVSIDKPTKRPSVETDAVRPHDEKEIKLLKRKDPYGHYKFSCEEALIHYQKEKNGFPWVSLRLADVIGPRDTTNRWWTYQLWVKFYPEIENPIFMPAHVANKIESLTFVEDVAKVVTDIVDLGEPVWNEAYNIAMEEVLGNSEDTEKSFYLYPTVFSGNMDISKAKKILKFQPTSAVEAFEKTMAWYEEAFVKYPTQRDIILSELFQTAVPKQNRDAVYLAIDRELTKMGHTEEKYAKKKKGDLGSLPSAVPEDKDEL